MFIIHHQVQTSYFRDPTSSPVLCEHLCERRNEVMEAHFAFTVQSCIFDCGQSMWHELTLQIYSHFQCLTPLYKVGLDLFQPEEVNSASLQKNKKNGKFLSQWWSGGGGCLCHFGWEGTVVGGLMPTTPTSLPEPPGLAQNGKMPMVVE